MRLIALLSFCGAACAPVIYRLDDLATRAEANEVATHYELAEDVIYVEGVAADRGFIQEGNDLVVRFDGNEGAVTKVITGVKEPTPYVVLRDDGGEPLLLCLFDFGTSLDRASAGKVELGASVTLRGMVTAVRRDSVLLTHCAVPDPQPRRT